MDPLLRVTSLEGGKAILQAQGIAPPPVRESPVEEPGGLEINIPEASGSGSHAAELAQASQQPVDSENIVRRPGKPNHPSSNVTIFNARIHTLEVELTQLREARDHAAVDSASIKTELEERPAKRIKREP